MALRAMRSPAALNALSAAIDDADRDVRYRAVAGLAELAGENDWLPSMPEFIANETRYLEHWRAWIDRNTR
jgi:HEAT repeat protein